MSSKTRTRTPWTPEEVALLGTDSDRAIAARLNRSIRSIEGARSRHGIRGHSGQGFGGIKWGPESEAVLGTAPDKIIAERLGTTRLAVQRRRRRLGISAYGRWPTRPGPDAKERHRAESWLRDALADGPRPAAELLDEAVNGQGMAKRTLDRARSALKVVAYRQYVLGPWWWRLPRPSGQDF